MTEQKQEILLGAGTLYVVPESIDLENATDAEIEAALVKVGESAGESTLNVAYEFRDIRGGAKNQILKSMMTSETVTFNAGVVTFDLKTIKDFLAAHYSEDGATGKRTLGIGGIQTVPIKQLRFVHDKEDGYPIYLDMYKAQNRAGLNWTFNPEEETTFSFEFTLLADTSKQNGNIVKITEKFAPTGAA